MSQWADRLQPESGSATKAIIGVCVALFGLQALLSPGGFSIFGGNAQLAVAWGAVVSAPGLPFSLVEPWRYLSATLLHFGVLHVLFNMMALWHFGQPLEQRIGSVRLAIVFFLTGSGAFVISDLWYALWGQPLLTVGASGAIFGVGGALAGNLLAAKNPFFRDLLIRLLVYGAIMWLAFSGGGMLNVNNAAHFGGLALGVPLGWLAWQERRPERRTIWFAIAAGMLLVVSLITPVQMAVRMVGARTSIADVRGHLAPAE